MYAPFRALIELSIDTDKDFELSVSQKNPLSGSTVAVGEGIVGMNAGTFLIVSSEKIRKPTKPKDVHNEASRIDST